MRHIYGLALISLLAAALLVLPAHGQQVNLLLNPGFDADLSGWTLQEMGAGSATWSPQDLGGLMTSGSARLFTSIGIASLSQCVTRDYVPPELTARASIRSSLGGVLSFQVITYSSPGCSGQVESRATAWAGYYPGYSASPPDGVRLASVPYVSSSSLSLTLTLTGIRSESGSYVASEFFLDDVFLGYQVTPIELLHFTVD